mgnify:CR=1 FL=1
MDVHVQKWKNFLKESYDKAKLYVFDFDDTIIKSTAPIVHTPTGKSMSTDEFEQFKELNPEVRSEEFDFSAFKDMVQGNTFDKTVDIMVSAANSGYSVVILTARSDAAPVKDFVSSNIGLNIPVIAINNPEFQSIGDTDPERKASWIKQQMLSGYNQVEYYEDSDKNIAAVQNLRYDQEMPPNSKIFIYKVVGTPENTKFLQKEIEIYQKKVRSGHKKDKGDYLAHGGQETASGGGPYRKKPSLKRAKSAPPGAGGV